MADQEYYVTALQKAPSLCDLPLTCADMEQSNERRGSLSEMADFFEFLTPNLNRSSDSWNDLVWPLFSSTADENHRNLASTTPPPSNCISKARQSECLNESKIATRSSIRSLGHCRIRRDVLPNRSKGLNQVRFPSDRETSCRSGNGLQRRSPPWYKLALRPLRFPPAAEIDLRKEDKILQSCSPTTLFPAAEKASCDRSAWKLINALSCKNHGSVAATTPFHP